MSIANEIMAKSKTSFMSLDSRQKSEIKYKIGKHA